MSTTPKKNRKPGSPTQSNSKESVLWNKASTYLDQKFNYVFSGLLLLGALLRVIYFVQLNQTPCINYHLSNQSDMYFFDQWAKHLSQDDWLQHTSYNNYTTPHKVIAESYFKKYPQKLEEIKKLISPDSSNTLDAYGKALFEKWNGEKVYFQEPFYPYFVATIYTLFTADVRWVFLFQMLIGLGTLALIMLITKFYFGGLAALFSGVLALLYGPLMFYELILLRETFIIFIGLLLVYTLAVTLDKTTPLKLFFCGLFIGVSILIKSIFGIFAIAFLVLIFFKGRKNVEGYLKPMMLAGGAILLALLPLIIRNLIVGVSPLSIATNGTYTFITSNFYGYSPERGFMVDPSNADIYYKTDGVFLPSFIETFKSFPSWSDILDLFWRKFKMLFLWVEVPNNKSFYYYQLNASVLQFTALTFAWIAALSIPGMVLSFFRKSKPISLYLLLFTHFAILMGFYVLSRYRIPLAAAMIPFAGFMLSDLFKRIETTDFKFLVMLGAAIGIFLLVNRKPVESVTTIRGYDYINPFEYYYKPAIDSAEKLGDHATTQRLYEKYLSLVPKEVSGVFSGKGKVSNRDLSTIQFYLSVFEGYDMVLKQIGDQAKVEELDAKINKLRGYMDQAAPTAENPQYFLNKSRATQDPTLKKQFLIKAIDGLKQRMAQNSNDVVSRQVYAEIMLNEDQNEAGFIQYLKDLMQKHPNEPGYPYQLGHYYLFSKKDVNEARRLLELCIKLDPRYANAYTDLGYYHAGYKRYPEAVVQLRKAIELNPADSQAVRYLTRITQLMK